MEKRIGTAIIMVRDKQNIHNLNEVLSNFSEIIIGRMGVPVREKGINLISIVFEGSTDDIGALTGQIGRLKGIKIKSVVLKYEEKHETP